jgi:AcrR family transcriptional regulator
VTAQRRLGTENAKNRSRLVDATEWMLREEGYAAVTARGVAAKAGLKVQLVYYYFQTMDDLILAVVRRFTARRLERFEEALASPEPLRALWQLNSDATGIPASELIALANHRESIRTEVVAAACQFRALQIEAVDRLLTSAGFDRKTYSAAGIVAIVAAVARAMVQDCALGVSEGYGDAVAIIERGLALYGSADVPASAVEGMKAAEKTRPRRHARKLDRPK